MINPYIEKSKECIKSIPSLKGEIQELTEQIKQGNRDKNTVKVLQKKTILLKHYIGILEQFGVIGHVLIDIYFNQKDNRIIANKYGLCTDTVQRYKYFSDKYNNDWQTLAVLLYGIDALLME